MAKKTTTLKSGPSAYITSDRNRLSSKTILLKILNSTLKERKRMGYGEMMWKFRPYHKSTVDRFKYTPLVLSLLEHFMKTISITSSPLD